ncbi:MAG TPA: Maf family protein [Patescibacteria group bacterium]|nr:Maf family protein [Patescibacteria group bacterium]
MQDRTSRPIILGSSSHWRANELKALGLPFVVMAADIDEKAIRHPDPAILTWHIAVAKASVLLARVTEPSWLITCDQVAVFRGEIREKPSDGGEARRWLAEYGTGEPVSTVTTVVVTDTATRRSVHATDVARAWFDPLPERAVESALSRGDVLGSCGAFTIDDPDLAPFVSLIEGDGDETEVRSSISGLPRAKTLALLERLAHPTR